MFHSETTLHILEMRSLYILLEERSLGTKLALNIRRGRFMKFLIFSLVLFACSGSNENQSIEKKQSNSNDITFSNIFVQQFAHTENQMSFDIMPVTSEGIPIGCEDSNINFQISQYKDGVEIENSSLINIKCEDSVSSDVGLVIDNSGSVRSHRLIVEKSLEKLSNHLFSIGSMISLTEVNTNSYVRSPLINSTEKLTNAYSSFLNRDGWTSLYDGVRMSHETLEDRFVFDDEIESACDSKRKAIIIMTDGKENNSNDQMYEEYSLDDFPGDSIDTTVDDIRSLNSNYRKVPIFSIGVGAEVDELSLRNISESSGGTFRSLSEFNQVESAFIDISNFLQSPYSVCVDSSSLSCGEYKVIVDYNSESGPDGSKEIVFNIPCEENSDPKDEQKDEIVLDLEDNEDISDEEEINFYNLDKTKEIEFPLFDDEKGKKELLSVNLEFEHTRDVSIQLNSEEILIHNSRVEIFDEQREIIDISKDYSKETELITSYNDIKKTSGIYKFPSHVFDFFKGKGSKKFNIRTFEDFSWDSKQIVSGNIGILGKFKLRYIWRYRKIEGVIIPDSNLRLAVRNLTGIRTGPITVEAMENLSSINVSNKIITTFEGLQYAKNLKYIYVSNTTLRELDFFEVFSGLQHFDISNNPISDFSPLVNMKSLVYLNMNSTNFSNMNIVKDLASLNNLQINSTDVKDLFPLKDMHSLITFSFRYCDIANYFQLAYATSLKSLDLYGCINDPSSNLALRKNHEYSYINLSRTNLSSLVKLSDIEVKNLVISNNSFGSFVDLAKIKSITNLTATSNNLGNEDFKIACDLPYLNHLNLNGNKIDDIEIGKINSTLKKLYLNSNLVTDLIHIGSFSNLTRFYFNNNPVESLEPLSLLQSLTVISAQNTSMVEISSLASLANLNWLDIGYNDLSNIDIDFSNFPNLTSLMIRSVNDNNISFVNNPKVSYFDLRYNLITCDDQKLLVEKQYAGATIKYEEVEGCPYVYQTGVNTRNILLSDTSEIGIQYFGDFAGADFIEEMKGSYSDYFEPIQLNSYESIESLKVSMNINISTHSNTNLETSQEIKLSEEMILVLKVGDEEIHQSKFTPEQIINLDMENQTVQLNYEFKETIELSNDEVTKFMSAEKIDYEIIYKTNPKIISGDEIDFSVDHTSIGSITIDYNILQEF